MKTSAPRFVSQRACLFFIIGEKSGKECLSGCSGTDCSALDLAPQFSGRKKRHTPIAKEHTVGPVGNNLIHLLGIIPYLPGNRLVALSHSCSDHRIINCGALLTSAIGPGNQHGKKRVQILRFGKTISTVNSCNITGCLRIKDRIGRLCLPQKHTGIVPRIMNQGIVGTVFIVQHGVRRLKELILKPTFRKLPCHVGFRNDISPSEGKFLDLSQFDTVPAYRIMECVTMRSLAPPSKKVTTRGDVS